MAANHGQVLRRRLAHSLQHAPLVRAQRQLRNEHSIIRSCGVVGVGERQLASLQLGRN